jgi:Cytochrome domain of cellobiose dehydrogenase
MVAPSGTQWLGLGQGKRMAGANMFVMYASGRNNITLSPRLGRDEIQPNINQEAQLSLLEGTGISSDGIMTANIRCDSCLTWDGGSMSPTSGSSNWIWAIKQGSALNSGDLSADIRQHDAYGVFTFDLPAGTSSDSANPFVQAATVTQSAGSSQPSSPGNRDESSSGSSSDSSKSSESESNNSQVRRSHGIIMAVVFLFLFPIGALMTYLPFSRKILFAHVPLQLLSVSLLIVAMALGVKLGVDIDAYDEYHQIIGYITVSCLVLFQPALGLIQHVRFRKVEKRTIFGYVHQWLGRILILLGIVNGGLGLRISGEIGSEDVPRWSVIAYGVAAGVVGLLYIAVVSGSGLIRKRKSGSKEEIKQRNGNADKNGY